MARHIFDHCVLRCGVRASATLIYERRWVFLAVQTLLIYIQYDTLYGLNKDTFVVIQSWLNIVEAIFALVAVILSFSGSAKTRLRSGLLAIIISAFVFWKTVIFLIYDKDFITPAVKSFESGAILFYMIPSSLWIIFPLLTMYKVSKRIIKQSIEVKGKKEWEWKWLELELENLKNTYKSLHPSVAHN